MLLKGFRFGLMLQFAIGPVCLYIFQTATLNGFFIAETGVLGVAVMDGLFILLAILGMAALIKSKEIKSGLRLFGAVILFVFGVSMVVSIIGINLIPSLNITGSDSKSSFVHAIILTASNPLTILFWSGIFSTKIVEENMKQKEVFRYGLGAVLSTLFFLTVVALSGNLVKPLFSPFARKMLNAAMGMLLILFSLKMGLKKDNKV